MQNKVFFIPPSKLFWSQGTLFNIQITGKRPPSSEKQSLSELNLWNICYLGNEPTAIWCWYILILIYISYRNYFKANVSKKHYKRKKHSTRRPGSELTWLRVTCTPPITHLCHLMNDFPYNIWRYLLSTLVVARHKYFILKKIIRFFGKLPIILLMWPLSSKYIFKKKQKSFKSISW